MPKSALRRHKSILAMIASGATADVWLGLQQAASAEAVTTGVGMPGVGTCATVLAKTGGQLVAGLGVNLWSRVLGQPTNDGLNGDLDKASGRAIAAAIRDHLPELEGKAKDLTELADAIVAHHDPAELDAVGGDLPVDVADAVSHPDGFLKQAALSKDHWRTYLRGLAEQHPRLNPLRVGSNLETIAGALSAAGEGGYNERLYKELKADAGIDGKAFGGAVLRMLNTILEQVGAMREDVASTAEATWNSVKKLRDELDAPAVHASLQVIQDQRAELSAEVGALRTTVGALPQVLDELLGLQKQTLNEVQSVGSRVDSVGRSVEVLAEQVAQALDQGGKGGDVAGSGEDDGPRPLPEGRLDLRTEERGFRLSDLIHGILPDLADAFRFEGDTAWTQDDKASLGLIGAAIEHCANEEIQVIGRGPQAIDLNTDAYVAAAARAILRGVKYRRVLYIDERLPANGVLWLLLLERFMAEPEWHGQVELRIPPECPQSTLAVPQFQILDRAFVHHTQRVYADGTPGAARKVLRADFALAPSHTVEQSVDAFEAHLPECGTPLTHGDVAARLTSMLGTLDANGPRFHSEHVLLADRFLDSLEVEGLPRQHVHFVGCLMPTTFTYEAAARYARDAGRDGERFVPLPFRTLDEAIAEFNPGALEYLCVPVENSKIGSIAPPMETYDFEKLKREAEVVATVELPVRFVLACKAPRYPAHRGLVGVQPALDQLDSPPDPDMPTNPGAAPESNYAAAMMAREDPTLMALTTEAAALHAGLEILDRVPAADRVGVTTFQVFRTRQ